MDELVTWRDDIVDMWREGLPRLERVWATDCDLLPIPSRAEVRLSVVQTTARDLFEPSLAEFRLALA